eukprot:3886884-Alexandrium_andersonii.AAC.1
MQPSELPASAMDDLPSRRVSRKVGSRGSAVGAAGAAGSAVGDPAKPPLHGHRDCKFMRGRRSDQPDPVDPNR